jgi:hypothetical protein
MLDLGIGHEVSLSVVFNLFVKDSPRARVID